VPIGVRRRLGVKQFVVGLFEQRQVSSCGTIELPGSYDQVVGEKRPVGMKR
jgi:hypothetical protein